MCETFAGSVTPQAGLLPSVNREGEDRPLIHGRRPEAQLLLCCARREIAPSTRLRIESLLQTELDWEYVCKKAQQHRITPLVYRALEEVGQPQIPAAVLDQLRLYIETNTQFNLFRTGQLVKLLRLLGREGVSAVPFKGPVLSVVAYQNLALREYGDLDVLVRPGDVARTAEILLANGYRLFDPPGGDRAPKKFSSKAKDLALEADHGVRLEVHWRLTDRYFRFPLDLNQLWPRLEKVTLAGADVPTLGAEDLLVYLCMHGSRHGWERLIWVCDVAELIRACPAIVWNTVIAQSARLGCERMVSLGLWLAVDLLGAELPEHVKRNFKKDTGIALLIDQLVESSFDSGETTTDIAYWYDMHLRIRERRRDRLRLRLHYYYRYLRLAVRPNELDQAMLRLPRRLSFLYFVLRPFRLIKSLGITRLKRSTRTLSP